MADTPPQPPGWPYNEDPDAAPPPIPPEAPSFEPPAQPGAPAAPQYQAPPPAQPGPPAAPQYQAPPPAQPGPPAAPHYQAPPPAQPGPPAAPNYQAPPQPAAPAYEPPVPGIAPTPMPPPSQYGGPGQPPPPPGWGPPAAPVKKSRRSLWITLAVIFGVIFLAIGGCTVWFVGAVKAPVDASNNFLAAIDAGDYAGAIALSDPGCSFGMSEGDLVELFQGADITYNLNNSSVINSSATVSGSFSVAGQDVDSISIELRNSGGWKVCGFNAN